MRFVAQASRLFSYTAGPAQALIGIFSLRMLYGLADLDRVSKM